MSSHPQAKGRKAVREEPCQGVNHPASQLTGPDRGICPVCGQDRSVYDSSTRGRGLMAPHADPRRVV